MKYINSMSFISELIILGFSLNGIFISGLNEKQYKLSLIYYSNKNNCYHLQSVNDV